MKIADALVKAGITEEQACLLIDEMTAIHALRADDGTTVAILCDNPDAGPPNAIEVCGPWTEWDDQRFEGGSLLECLSAAVHAKGLAS